MVCPVVVCLGLHFHGALRAGLEGLLPLVPGNTLSQSSPYASSVNNAAAGGAETKRSVCRESEICQQKRKADLAETEDFYMLKFQQYLLTGNLVRRLLARAEAIKAALGGAPAQQQLEWSGRNGEESGVVRREASVESDGPPLTPLSSDGESFARPPSLPPKPRKKRIGDAGRMEGEPDSFLRHESERLSPMYEYQNSERRQMQTGMYQYAK